MSDYAVIALDIDGTLIDLSGGGRRAMYRALEEHLGEPLETDKIPFAGNTDWMIVSEVLKASRGADPLEEREIREVFSRYLQILPAEMERTPYSPTPGALDLVRELQGDPAVVVGLATGNIEPAALMKLTSVGLTGPWDFQAFGDQPGARAAMVQRAIEAATARLPAGATFRKYVLGDTPRDIAAAHAVGAQAVVVATGPFTVEELLEYTPELVFEVLSDALARPFWRGGFDH